MLACQSIHSHVPIGVTCMGAILCLFLSACALTHPFIQSTGQDEVLVDNAQGTVFLQKADDGWFKTAHPRSVSPAIIASMLRGVHVKAASAGAVKIDLVFSDKDTEFLSALISTALSKADKRQVIGFRVRRGTGTESETTGGILYLQGRLLHLTFTHYRAQQERSGQAGLTPRLIPNPMGLDTHQLTFIPETAKRSSRHEQPDVISTPSLASLVIDYEELAMASGLQPTPTQPQPVRLGQSPDIQRRDQSNAPGLQESPAHSPGTDTTLPFVEDRLWVLKRLHDQGLITEEDYRVKKQQLLDQF